jgi:hypothetical protein
MDVQTAADSVRCQIQCRGQLSGQIQWKTTSRTRPLLEAAAGRAMARQVQYLRLTCTCVAAPVRPKSGHLDIC